MISFDCFQESEENQMLTVVLVPVVNPSHQKEPLFSVLFFIDPQVPQVLPKCDSDLLLL